MLPAEKPDDVFESIEAESAEPAGLAELLEPAEPAEPAGPEAVPDPSLVETRETEVGGGIEAEFMLETSAVCPHCLADMDRIHVVRMLRTKVNFVSSLPRRGQMLVCPQCRIALAGALGGLI